MMDRILMVALSLLAIVMVGLVALVVVAIVSSAGQTHEQWLQQSVSTYHDADHAVTCWIYRDGFRGGISCIPDQIVGHVPE